MIIIKRDGRQVVYDVTKILSGILKAASEAKVDLNLEAQEQIMKYVDENIKGKQNVPVEKIQDLIEKALYVCGHRKIRESYREKRKERNEIRELKSEIMNTIHKIGIETDRDNANVGNNFSSKLLRIASESNKWHNLAIMPKHIAKSHENGDIYYHDLDSYNLALNCLHIPTLEILKKGFNTGYGTLNTPKRIESAAELSCILLQSTQNDMFGGQSHPDFDNDLSYFVQPTRQEIINDMRENSKYEFGSEEFNCQIEKKVLRSVQQAMQSIVYNLNTMHARAGSQVPFSSVNLGIPLNEDAALICKVFLEEYEKGLGRGEQPIFPNIIFRVKKGVNRDKKDPYYYLYKLACRVAAKRMNPTFMNIDSDFNKEWYDKGIIPATMGCRTYIMSNINSDPGVKGRGNNAPVTINLPRLGILAKQQADSCNDFSNKSKEDYTIKVFYDLLDERLNQSREALLHRYSILKNLKVKDLPFVIGQGLMMGSEDLNMDDSIDPVIKNGTFGIGFIGLAETLISLIGKHHGESELARDLGEQIVARIRKACDDFKIKDKLNWSCYATPAEGLSGRFIIQDKKMFGIIPGVTDKDYYTNSYHIPVNHIVSIKNKINIEAPYHKLCNAGHISYIEIDYTPTGEDIENIITYAYENSNISYIGVNFHIRYCKDCGTHLHGETCCPSCKSTNIQGVSRVTGYLSLDERFGAGKSAEREDRISHTHSHEKVYNMITK